MEIFSHSQLGTPPSSWQSTQLITLWKQALSFIAAWKTKWDSSWEGNQLSPSSGPRTLDQPPGSGASHLGHSGLQSLTFIHQSTVLDRGPPMGILEPSSASHQTQHGGRHSPEHSNGPHVPSLQSALQTSHAPAFLVSNFSHFVSLRLLCTTSHVTSPPEKPLPKGWSTLLPSKLWSILYCGLVRVE